jgi:putative intracellular protease/amidase
MVITSNGRLGDTGRKTGFWLEELAAPYYVFKDFGAQVTLASPKGGRPPVDPASEAPEALTDACKRFRQDGEAQAALNATAKLADVSAKDFDAVFYPGGHGPLWDLAEDDDSISVIEEVFAAGKPVGAVCHGPAVLRHARKYDGTPLVQGLALTGFTNAEEKAVGLSKVVPFSLEDELGAKGGRFESAGLFAPHAVADKNLVTGQNPASSEAAARKLLALMKSEAK